MADKLTEPLSKAASTALINALGYDGSYIVGHHAQSELRVDDINAIDIAEVLSDGVVKQVQLEGSVWRYRVVLGDTTLVVRFLSIREAKIITGWRDD